MDVANGYVVTTMQGYGRNRRKDRWRGPALVCGLSGSAALLVAARAAQGLGAALVTPAALSILTGAYPEGRVKPCTCVTRTAT